MDESIRARRPDEMLGMVHSILTAPLQAREEQLMTYRALLLSHDWEFEFSEDPAVYRRGREERNGLNVLQRELDAGRSIWNELAPAFHQVVSA